jgi:hypothetical protein
MRRRHPGGRCGGSLRGSNHRGSFRYTGFTIRHIGYGPTCRAGLMHSISAQQQRAPPGLPCRRRSASPQSCPRSPQR